MKLCAGNRKVPSIWKLGIFRTHASARPFLQDNLHRSLITSTPPTSPHQPTTPCPASVSLTVPLTCSGTRRALAVPRPPASPAERARPPGRGRAADWPRRGGRGRPRAPAARPGAGRRRAVAAGRHGAAGAPGPAEPGRPRARPEPAAPSGQVQFPRAGRQSPRAGRARSAPGGPGKRSCDGTWLPGGRGPLCAR